MQPLSSRLNPIFPGLHPHMPTSGPATLSRTPGLRFAITPSQFLLAGRQREIAGEREKAQRKGANAPAAKTARIVAGKFTMRVL